MRVGVTGSSGLVGSRLIQLERPGFELEPITKATVDLGSPDVESWSTKIPDVDAIVHLGAATNVDVIEKERGLGERSTSFIVNALATGALARVAARRQIPFLLVSTDFVFPTAQRGPFPESASPTRSPGEVSWYGWTKLVAEKETLHISENAILRISYPFRPPPSTRDDHARRLVRLYLDGSLYPLYDDQWFTPSYVDDAINCIAQLLEKNLSGIFHSAPSDRTTPFRFGTALLEKIGVLQDRPIRATFPATVPPGRAARPRDGGLATASSKRAGLPISDIDSTIRRFAQAARGDPTVGRR